MALSKKAWIWIIVGVLGTGMIGLVAIAGAGVYFVTSHVASKQSTSADAFHAFDAVRAQFKDVKPLIEIDSMDRAKPLRALKDLPTSKVKPDQLWVLVWNPDEERLVKVSLPFWLMRMGRRKLDITSGNRAFDLDRLNLDVYELERIGPALVMDLHSPTGTRVLLWTQ